MTSEAGNTTTFSPSITYELRGSRDVFKMPDLMTFATSDIHLVVLTHGIHGSMLDELYIKEAIEEKYMNRDTSRIVFFMPDVNHSCTEDGIEICGKRLAIDLLQYVEWPWVNDTPLISKISLVGHSLGGLINIFLIGYLNSVTNGGFFRDIQPINFITVASPLLGSSEHPWFIKAGMRLGAIGQTGKDLALIPRSRSEQERAKGAVEEDTFEEEPLLLALAQPTSPSHVALRQFQNRTIYANVENDISVSFRTSALYFYDSNEINIKEGNIIKQLYHLLNPPEATEEYLTRSIMGVSPIIHDKVYTPSDIPRSRDAYERALIEEKIARAWHEDMSWRKVFVQLEGEAHTNVIVRRKWHNAAGWQVIEHLLNEHEF